MTTYQIFTTALGAVQSRAHLSKTSCTRMSRFFLRKREGRVRVPLDISVVQASNPHLHPLPFSKGRGDRNRLSNRSFR
jgi:hypothetical protein